MIQVLLIVLPCTLVGTAAVLLVQRAGWLPKLEPQAASPTARGRTRKNREWSRPNRGSSRPVAIAAVVVMSLWILFWIVLLAVGLNIIYGAS
jgi:hypothetical protein